MMHKAWSSIEEVPYCFSRSSIKFQGHMALKNVEFDPNWAFPDCNSSLNSPKAMKYYTKLETAKERCPIVFQRHPSNFKVTRDKTSPFPDYRPVTTFKSLRFALLLCDLHFPWNHKILPLNIWSAWYSISFIHFHMMFEYGEDRHTLVEIISMFIIQIQTRNMCT